MKARSRDLFAAVVFAAAVALIVGLGFLASARGDHEATAHHSRQYSVADVRRAFAAEGVRLERIRAPLATQGMATLSTSSGDVQATVYLRPTQMHFALGGENSRFASRGNVDVVDERGQGRLTRIRRAFSLLSRPGAIPYQKRVRRNLTAAGTAIFMTRGGEASNWSLPLHGFVRDVRGRNVAELGIHAFGSPVRLRAGRYRLAIEDACSGDFRVLPRQRVWIVVRLLRRSCQVRISFHR